MATSEEELEQMMSRKDNKQYQPLGKKTASAAEVNVAELPPQPKRNLYQEREFARMEFRRLQRDISKLRVQLLKASKAVGVAKGHYDAAIDAKDEMERTITVLEARAKAHEETLRS